ncbi:MAG: lytic transglycosylase [Caulobacteraceae bacterium]|nr:lytic transglycosylase [Caulobacteraceae bacterium]
MNLGLGFRGTSLAIGVALTCAGLATAQGLTGDSPQAGVSGPIAYDTPSVSATLSAAKSGDASRLRAILNQTTDPLARKVALWAMADAAPEALTWDEANAARRDLADWPRPSRRQVAAEKLLDRSGLSPAAIVGWFGADVPLTAQGAMALADAQRMTGHPDDAAAGIRRAWRNLAFDEETQETMLARFAGVLTQADHVAREDFLLYGAQGPAAQDLLRLLPPAQQALAQARMAVRRSDPAASTLVAALPPTDQISPGLVYERVLSLRDHGDIGGALALIPYLPATLPDEHAAQRLWKHGALVVGALQAGDANTAYQVAARSGLTSGPDAAEAQFYAGWIALSRFKDPKLADNHFERLAQAGASPLTQSRALYWRGRAAEAEGDQVTAQIFYGQAAKYYTTFYGQLAATKGGKADLVLGHDPTITPADRAAFEARDCVRATRLLEGMGDKEAVRTLVVGLSDSLPTAVDEALLVDLARGYGEQELSMRVVRNAARRGFILPERGYPIRSAPVGYASAEAPLVLSVTRQESSFDPFARSGAGARGMMQLMPTTAQNVARRSGLGWGSLDDPDFNMKVGSVYLDQLVNQFSGSYVMAAAAYNAGPSRPTLWAGLCGDPRASSTDPLDFIECIPFSETRDYVMRVMEATQVYRARLNGGTAPVTLALDLKRGSYGYQPLGSVQPVSTPPVPIVLNPPGPGGR